MTIFDFISSIITTKKVVMMDEEAEKVFSPYMMNRWLSMYSPQIASVVNDTVNMWGTLFDQKDDQYKLLLNLIPKQRFKKIEYIKKVASKPKTEKEIELENIERMTATTKHMSVATLRKLQLVANKL